MSFDWKKLLKYTSQLGLSTASDTQENPYSLSGLSSSSAAQERLQNSTYRQNASVAQAQRELEAWKTQRPGEYTSRYQGQIDELLEQIQNREKFRYDYTTDPLYAQYARQYRRNAKAASENAAAQAAALSGGYGSSYAESVAQQAYQQQMDLLNEVVPQLYAQALSEYNAEGDELYNQVSLLSAQEQAAQSEYYAELDAYNRQLDQLLGLYKDAYAEDYAAYSDYLDSLADLRDYYAKQEQAAQQAARQSGRTGSERTSTAPAVSASAGRISTAGSDPLTAYAELMETKAADSRTYVPYEAARELQSGASLSSIRRNLKNRGYSESEIEDILKQLR